MHFTLELFQNEFLEFSKMIITEQWMIGVEFWKIKTNKFYLHIFYVGNCVDFTLKGKFWFFKFF